MENTQLRLFNAFKRSGFNENDAMDVASFVEKVSDVGDIRTDVSEIRSKITAIETQLVYIKAILFFIAIVLFKIAFF